MLHHAGVLVPVDLRAQGVHGRPLAEVQHAALQRACVRRLAHFAAERIDLPHKMALCRAADARVAGAVAHRIHVDRKHRRTAPEPRRRERGLNARVPRADHGNIQFSSIINHSCFP